MEPPADEAGQPGAQLYSVVDDSGGTQYYHPYYHEGPVAEGYHAEALPTDQTSLEPAVKRQRLEGEAAGYSAPAAGDAPHPNHDYAYAGGGVGYSQGEAGVATGEEGYAAQAIAPARQVHPWVIEEDKNYFHALYVAEDEFAATQSASASNFLKQAKWSADGTCILTTSEDNIVRVFELPADAMDQAQRAAAMTAEERSACVPQQITSVLQAKEGETIYDASWYPLMDSQQPSTCCFLTTSRDHPIHLWDAFTGQHRATYRAYDHMDEITAAISVSFNLTGEQIYAGYAGTMRVFDTGSPGRSYHTFSTKDLGQKGIISCMAFDPWHSGLFAVGSYTGRVGLYSEEDSSIVSLLEGHQGGVTQVLFTPDGNYLFSGARKENVLLCWDIRNTSRVVMRLSRIVENNQHVHFDIDPTGRYLITGSQDMNAYVYDLQTGRVTSELVGHTDVVNSASFHPHLPVVATATGERKYKLQVSEEEASTTPDDDAAASTEKGKEKVSDDDEKGKQQNVLSLWCQLPRISSS